MKTSLVITGVIALGTAVGSFTWIPPALDGTREWMNEPAFDAISKQTTMMAQMKKYDIDTDELSDDVKVIEDRIEAIQGQLLNDQDMSDQTKQFLELQIESEKKRWIQKDDKLHQSKLIDQKTLSLLQGQSS